MFRTVPLSIIRSSSLYTQEWYMSYSLRAGSGRPSWSCSQAVSKPVWHIAFAVCTVKNSWWWTEELSETCRVLFQKWIWEISGSSWFYYEKVSNVSGERRAFVFSAFFWELKNLECEFTTVVPNVDNGLPSDAASYTIGMKNSTTLIWKSENSQPPQKC